MQKYLTLFKVTVDQYFVYRLNFILWRFRAVLNLIMIYFLWTALYTNRNNLFGYSQQEMLTYVLIVSIFSDFVFSSRIHELGAEILTGDIINKLLKPIGFLKYLITKEIADKAINISFAIVEISLLILILEPIIILPENTVTIYILILHLLIGLTLSFFLSFSIAMIAFWTAEIWAPRFIYFILVFVLAGNYFPLDILPTTFYNLLLLTPFPYFIFLPAQIYI
ncbi:MAG TPA: ABC-2 family transporter protein, partial [Candidatus Woesebacteria bacterium]|nr:ABC-2 family transporter protein [Candidatus Woesebacteria bacterium]